MLGTKTGTSAPGGWREMKNKICDLGEKRINRKEHPISRKDSVVTENREHTTPRSGIIEP